MLPRSPGLMVFAVWIAAGVACGENLDALVVKLPSEDFRTREEGSTELVKRGKEDQIPVRTLCLQQYLSSPNAEVRLRCKEVLRAITVVSPGFLGVQHHAKAYTDDKGKSRLGVELALVLKGQPADLAGLKAGDLVTEFDGKALDVDDPVGLFGRSIRALSAGEKTKVKLLRAGKVMTLPVTTGVTPREIMPMDDEEARFEDWLKAQIRKKPGG